MGRRLGPGTEFDLIRRLWDTLGGGDPDVAVETGPGDDGAVLAVPPGEKLVLSTDLAVEDVHFRRAWMRWGTVGYRAAAAALSDLAAMAARPLGVLLSAALPPELDRDVLDEMGAGIARCLSATGGTLLGGDLSRSPGPVMLDLVAVGAAERPVGRDGAAPGDELWVTGTLGGAAAAVADWGKGLEPDPRARRAFERPRPRIREARWLAERAEVTAIIDLSDGLAGDARHLAAASDVGVEVALDRVPLAEVLAEYADRSVALGRALRGGEDFELLVAAVADSVGPLAGAFEREFDLSLARVGRVTEGRGVRWLDARGEEVILEAGGHDHFGGGTA